MANEQTKKSLILLSDVYGKPNLTKETIDAWDEFLKDYTVGQVEEATFKVIRYNRESKFPTLTHLKSNLFDQPKIIELERLEKERLEKQKKEKDVLMGQERDKEEKQRKTTEYMKYLSIIGYNGLVDLFKRTTEEEYKRINEQFEKEYGENND